jgi:hypothetical protein
MYICVAYKQEVRKTAYFFRVYSAKTSGSQVRVTLLLSNLTISQGHHVGIVNGRK